MAGLDAKIRRYRAVDEWGDTTLSFLAIETKSQVVLLTLWGSDQEREANRHDIDRILASIRPAN